jgi:hypothetical protein
MQGTKTPKSPKGDFNTWRANKMAVLVNRFSQKTTAEITSEVFLTDAPAA